MSKDLRSCLALSLLAASGVSAQTKAWRTPVDATFTSCYEAKAQGALMDDGTLLVSCAPDNTQDAPRFAPLWQRQPSGSWQIAAKPPTPDSKIVAMRKLSGTVAIFEWSEVSHQGASMFQVWSTSSGASPAFSIPIPGDQGPSALVWDSWDLDERIIRIRDAKYSAPGTQPSGMQPSILELVDKSGLVVSDALSLEERKVLGAASACTFPNGDRLLTYASISIKQPLLPSVTVSIGAAILRKSGTWESQPELLGGLAQQFAGVRAYCPSDRIGRIAVGFGAPQSGYYIDLSVDEGWLPRQTLYAGSAPPFGGSTIDALLYARAPNGQAVLAWNYPEPATEPLTGQPGHSSIPVIHWTDKASRYFTADFDVPIYKPDLPDDAAVRAVAWDPGRQRFVFVLIGGAGPAARRFVADFSPGGGWSAASPLPSQMLDRWQLDFNSKGDGVLIARRHGQLLVSDWR